MNGLTIGGFMQIPTGAAAYADFAANAKQSGGTNARNVAQADAAFSALLNGTGQDDPAALLKEITSNGMKGYWAWEVKQMKQKATQEVMGAMGVSASDIAAMPDAQRATIEDKIMKAVEAKVKQMIQDDMNKKQKDSLGIDLNADASAGTGIGANLDISA